MGTLTFAPLAYPRQSGMTWADVREIGSIERDIRASGSVRIRLRFPDPWNHGKAIRLRFRRTPLGEWVPFDEQHALEDLAQIRNALLAGMTLKAALKPWVRRIDDEDRIENRAQVWLDDFARRVDLEERSPATLREYRRYADRFFVWWSGRDIYATTRRDVKDWQIWLGEAHPSLSATTRKKISDAFRAMLREHARDADGAIRVPDFPVIETRPSARRTMPLDDRANAMDEIPWSHRGAFLIAATECLRLSELRAYDLDDFEAPDRLRLQYSIQGSGREQRRVDRNKNRSAEWRELWNAETVRWIAWRIEQATPEARLRGEIALFWHPGARNRAKRWSTDPLEREWRRACAAAKVAYVPFQQATRHTTLSHLSKVLPERMLQAHSRHRDKRSLDAYTLAKPEREALVVAMRPPVAPPPDSRSEGDS